MDKVTSAGKIQSILNGFTANSSPGDKLRILAGLAIEWTDSEAACILALDEEQKNLPLVVHVPGKSEGESDLLPLDGTAWGEIILSDQPLLVNAASKYGRLSPGAQNGSLRSFLAVPLKFNGRRLGVLEVENKRAGDYSSEADLSILRLLALSASSLLENVTQADKNKQLTSNQDDLTWFQQRHPIQGDGLEKIAGGIQQDTSRLQGPLQPGDLSQFAFSTPIEGAISAHTYLKICNIILGLQRVEDVQNDFCSVLKKFTQKFSAESNLKVTLILPEEENLELPAQVEEQILHITLDAFENIQKHAQASRTEMIININEHSVQIMVIDDRVGFDSQHMAAGHRQPVLQSMLERAAKIRSKLVVHSSPDSGTRVILTIPIEQGQENLSDESMRQDFSVLAQDLFGISLLLVDDSPIFVDGLQNLLLARGLNICAVAYNAEQALELTRQLAPDVVLLDVLMPGVNGIETLKSLKAEFPDVKVIMLTNSEENIHLLQALNNGASGFLNKNLTAKELINALCQLVRGENPFSSHLLTQVVSDYSQTLREETQIKSELKFNKTDQQLIKLIGES